MKKLSAQDSAWLAIEGERTPMHIGGLSLFRLPEGAGPGHVREIVAQHAKVSAWRPPFNQKLLRGPAGLGWKLVEDEGMDVDYHIRHSALPANGTYRDLFVLVSRLHSIALDRQRPLWEFHIIEGLPDNQYATYTKVHHALADGSAGVRLMHMGLSPDAEARDLPSIWDAAADKPRGLIGSGERKARPGLRAQWAMVPQVAKVTTEMLRVATGLKPSPLRTPWQAPRSILNGRLSGARRVVCQSWPIARLQDTAKALDLTLNDLFLAMCSGAIRTYLQGLGALPSDPLICGVPVAISREGGDDGMGNSISMAFANLGTHCASPQMRIDAIRESIRSAKQMLSSLDRRSLMAYTALASSPLAVEQLSNLAGYLPPVFNLIVSNVPGPRNPLYWNGARLEHVYPISLLPDGQALNVTAVSYADSFDVGIVACRRTLPHMQRLIDHLEVALQELEALAGRSQGRKRKTAA